MATINAAAPVVTINAQAAVQGLILETVLERVEVLGQMAHNDVGQPRQDLLVLTKTFGVKAAKLPPKALAQKLAKEMRGMLLDQLAELISQLPSELQEVLGVTAQKEHVEVETDEAQHPIGDALMGLEELDVHTSQLGDGMETAVANAVTAVQDVLEQRVERHTVAIGDRTGVWTRKGESIEIAWTGTNSRAIIEARDFSVSLDELNGLEQPRAQILICAAYEAMQKRLMADNRRNELMSRASGMKAALAKFAPAVVDKLNSQKAPQVVREFWVNTAAKAATMLGAVTSTKAGTPIEETEKRMIAAEEAISTLVVAATKWEVKVATAIKVTPNMDTQVPAWEKVQPVAKQPTHKEQLDALVARFRALPDGLKSAHNKVYEQLVVKATSCIKGGQVPATIRQLSELKKLITEVEAMVVSPSTTPVKGNEGQQPPKESEMKPTNTTAPAFESTTTTAATGTPSVPVDTTPVADGKEAASGNDDVKKVETALQAFVWGESPAVQGQVFMVLILSVLGKGWVKSNIQLVNSSHDKIVANPGTVEPWMEFIIESGEKAQGMMDRAAQSVAKKNPKDRAAWITALVTKAKGRVAHMERTATKPAEQTAPVTDTTAEAPVADAATPDASTTDATKADEPKADAVKAPETKKAKKAWTVLGALKASAVAFDAGMTFSFGKVPAEKDLGKIIEMLKAACGTEEKAFFSANGDGPLVKTWQSVLTNAANVVDNATKAAFAVEAKGETYDIRSLAEKHPNNQAVQARLQKAVSAWGVDKHNVLVDAIDGAVKKYFTTDEGKAAAMHIAVSANYFLGRNLPEGERFVTKGFKPNVTAEDVKKVTTDGVTFTDKEVEEIVKSVNKMTTDKAIRAFMAQYAKTRTKLRAIKLAAPNEERSIEKLDRVDLKNQAIAQLLDEARMGSTASFKDWTCKSGLVQDRDVALTFEGLKAVRLGTGDKAVPLPLMGDQADTVGKLAVSILLINAARVAAEELPAEWALVLDQIRTPKLVETHIKTPGFRGYTRKIVWGLYVGTRFVAVNVVRVITYAAQPVLAVAYGARALGKLVMSKLGKDKEGWAAGAKADGEAALQSLKNIVLMPWNGIKSIGRSIKSVFSKKGDEKSSSSTTGTSAPNTTDKKEGGMFTRIAKSKLVQDLGLVGLTEYPLGEEVKAWDNQTVAEKVVTVVTLPVRAVKRVVVAQPVISAGVIVGGVAAGVAASVLLGTGALATAGIVVAGAAIGGLIGWGLKKLFAGKTAESKSATTAAATAATAPKAAAPAATQVTPPSAADVAFAHC